MYKTLIYLLMFIVVVLLQTFLFNDLNMGVYINPLFYIVFISLLPIEIPGALMMLLALLTGVSMDLVMGTAGLNTIATLFTAFCRPLLLTLTVGKDVVKDGGVPDSKRLGNSKYLRYIILLVFIHCLVFFTFESLSLSYYYLTLLRVVLSTVTTVVFIYFFQLLFSLRS